MYPLKAIIGSTTPALSRRNLPLAPQILELAGRSWDILAVTDQDALLRQVQTDEELENFPYGLALWPSAIGLARWLAENPELVRGVRVLELGAGVGLVGLIASWLGAQVTQTDYLEDALLVCQENARRNGLAPLTVRRADWRDFPSDLLDFPVVVASDILYERSLHPALGALLPRLLHPGGQLIVSDPLRPQALEFLEALERSEEWREWEVRFDGCSVRWLGEPKDVAIIRVCQRGEEI